MRYLIFLCASGTTLGGGVRESTVSGGYLAWYLVQDQEDEFQSAAAVFCQTFALQAASQIRLEQLECYIFYEIFSFAAFSSIMLVYHRSIYHRNI
ncbi:hypothetical protein D917_01834 [Trichinella nativa]|uniref:Secreted protein n=1 Tax=Trichinella nativa TaxID=6335 RepID=A0A1Y3EKV4_9BILA|nr:hypothetical protein D917_01834 [Trichinella nativa]